MTTPYTKLVSSQRAFYRNGGLATIAERKKVIELFKTLLIDNKSAIDDAIFADLGRKPSVFSEVDYLLNEVAEVLEHIDEWAQPRKMPVLPNVLELSPETDSLHIVPEPFGVVLIIGPWNGPLLCLGSLVHAIAAGNTAITKPSELSANFSALFAKIVKKTFDEKILAVVEGGVAETTELLKERFDHIMYTGCPPVAKIIMTAAAKFLTPVTLELGGKNPLYVDSSANLTHLVKSVMKVKLFNAGQVCVSTDYILTTADMKPAVIAALSAAFDGLGDMSQLDMYARIINERHFHRLMSLLQKTKGKVVYKAKGEVSAKDRFIPMHLVECELDDEFMKEEIFGPLLPIITVKDFDTALEYIKTHEKPLAAYIVTENGEQARRFIRETSAGGVSVNDTMSHSMAAGMPFGGVGNSGMGRIGGKYGFDTFTHEKPVCLKGITAELRI